SAARSSTTCSPSTWTEMRRWTTVGGVGLVCGALLAWLFWSLTANLVAGLLIGAALASILIVLAVAGGRYNRTYQVTADRRTAVRLEIARIAVRNLSKARAVTVPEGCLTHDAGAVVNDPAIDVIVEVIGGIEPARSLVLDALKSGKPVVTGNKELLANVGAE